MSIANEIIRLQGAKSDIKDAIETQGVTVPSSAKLDVYDDYINQIGTKVNSIQTVLVNTETDPDTEEEYEVYTRGGDVISGTKIPNNQYSGRQDLVSVLFPDAINEFGDYAFYNCSNLTYVPLHNITKFGFRAMQGTTSYVEDLSLNNVTYLGGSTFNNSGITSVEVPDSVSTINSSEFAYCHNLTTASVYSNVDTLPNYLFRECENLSSVYFGNNVRNIGKYCFYRCTSLESFDFTNITTIQDFAFNGSKVYAIFAPNLTSISAVGTFGSSGLVEIMSLGNVTTIQTNNGAQGCFSSCYYLTTANLTGLISLGNDVFNNCTALSSVTAPDLKYIYANAFKKCSTLTQISLPSIIYLDGAGFAECTSLTSVNLGSSLTTIAANAFSQCNNLTNIEIPASCTSIGDKAFYKYDPDDSSYVASLTITINNTTPPTLGSQVFYCIDYRTKKYVMIDNLTIYVPAGSVSAYQSATNWSEYASKIQAIP